MLRCVASVSEGVLVVTNTLIFLIAAGSLGVCIYLFHDEVASSLTKVNLLTVVVVLTVPMMIFAFLGCRTALNPPARKCSRCLYLTILLLLFLVEFAIGGLVYNVCNALQVAKDNHFDIEGDAQKAARTVRNFIHDQLDDYYDKQDCHGGAAKSLTLPIEFQTISCKSSASTDAMKTILKDEVINDEQAFHTYQVCTMDSSYTPRGEKPSDFTQAFCGSQANIVKLAEKYSNYLLWVPVGLGILTLVLLIATMFVIGQKKRERVQMQGGFDGLNGRNVQISTRNR
jgi:hypothetical protein